MVWDSESVCVCVCVCVCMCRSVYVHLNDFVQLKIVRKLVSKDKNDVHVSVSATVCKCVVENSLKVSVYDLRSSVCACVLLLKRFRVRRVANLC